MLKHIWGNACWYLFHSLAEKLKQEYDTEEEITTLVYHFKQVCFNLPCPSCVEHSTKIIQRVNFNNIKNKETLKTFFWEFHNIVNKSINKTEFSKEECDELYKKANLIKIINNFVSIMKSREITSDRTMMNTYTRHLCVDSVVKYMTHNSFKYNV